MQAKRFEDFSESEVLGLFNDFVSQQGLTIATQNHKTANEITGRLAESAAAALGKKETCADYHLFLDAPQNGYYTNYKEGSKVYRWNIATDKSITEGYSSAPESPQAKAMKEQQANERRRQSEQAKAEQAAISAEKVRQARAYYEALPLPSTGDTTPYLVRKNVTLNGDARIDATHGYKNLIVPYYNAASDELSVIQTIYENGEKYFSNSIPPEGVLSWIQRPSDTDRIIAIAEGFATAADFCALSALPTASCADAGNLQKTGITLLAKYPDKIIIVAADDDIETERKTGKNTGLAAAAVIRDSAPDRVMIAKPNFFSDSWHSGRSDWNDLVNSEAAKYAPHLVDKYITEARAMLERLDVSQSDQYTAPEPAEAEPKTPLETLDESITKTTIERLFSLTEQEGRGLILPELKFYNTRKGTDYEHDPLQFSGLTICTARTGGGKTLLLTSLLGLLLRDKPEYKAVVFSLEESELAIYKRILGTYAIYTQEYEARIIPDNEIDLPLTVADMNAFFHHEPLPLEKIALIKSLAADLAERVQIITPSKIREINKALHEQAAAEGREYAVSFDARDSKDITDYMRYYRRKHGDNVAYFVDYVQKLKPRSERNLGTPYKEVQAVINDIADLANEGYLIFSAAQMNREVAKANTGEGTTPYKELMNACSEQMREGADIEQAASMILYGVIDRENKVFNMRVLKSRNDARDLTAAAPICWNAKAVLLHQLQPVDKTSAPVVSTEAPARKKSVKNESKYRTTQEAEASWE